MPFFKDLMKGERRSPHPLRKYDAHQVVDASADAEGATPQGAASTGDEAASPDEAGSAVTTAPADTHLVTTSMVMTTTTTTGDESAEKRRLTAKLQAANEFVYGRTDDRWTKPIGAPPLSADAGAGAAAAVRENRAQSMRRSCIMKRTKEDERERSRVVKQDAAWTGHEILDPIVARAVPKAVYVEPRILIRETKSSKFRYLYNRKPAGVKVYFRPVGEEESRRPPFVVAAVIH